MSRLQSGLGSSGLWGGFCPRAQGFGRVQGFGQCSAGSACEKTRRDIHEPVCENDVRHDLGRAALSRTDDCETRKVTVRTLARDVTCSASIYPPLTPTQTLSSKILINVLQQTLKQKPLQTKPKKASEGKWFGWFRVQNKYCRGLKNWNTGLSSRICNMYI